MSTNEKNLTFGTQKQQIDRLLPRHFKIIDLIMLGKTAAEIGRIVDMTKENVSRIVNSPTFQHELALRQSNRSEQLEEKKEKVDNDVADFLKKTAMQAAKTLQLGLVDGNPAIRIRSAVELLDRSGYPKQTVIKQTSTNVVVMDEECLNRIDETIQLLKTKHVVSTQRQAG